MMESMNLSDDYRITADRYCGTLEHRIERKKRDSEERYEAWEVVGYYGHGNQNQLARGIAAHVAQATAAEFAEWSALFDAAVERIAVHVQGALVGAGR